MASQRTSLNPPLPPQSEWFIAACVPSGPYETMSEAVRAGLPLLQQNEPGKDGSSQWGMADVRPISPDRHD